MILPELLLLAAAPDGDGVGPPNNPLVCAGVEVEVDGVGPPDNPLVCAGVKVQVDGVGPPNNPVVCDAGTVDKKSLEKIDVLNVGFGLDTPDVEPEVAVSAMVFTKLNLYVVADGVRERDCDGLEVGLALVKGA